MIEVFADVACPFTHAGLVQLVERRAARGLTTPIVVRAWPLEWVNGRPLDPTAVALEVAALRDQVVPDRFVGFDPDRFPASSIPALALAAAAYRVAATTGEAVSLALRAALFEAGEDIADPVVLGRIAAEHGVDPAGADAADVRRDYDEGRRRGVVGSPYFLTGDTGWFCPGLDISHDADGFVIRRATDRFEEFVGAALGSTPAYESGDAR